MKNRHWAPLEFHPFVTFDICIVFWKVFSAQISSFGMPKVATLRPDRSCWNYPFCKKAAKCARADGARQWQHFCEMCTKATTCAHPGCQNKAAPDGRSKSVSWSSHLRCVDHITDPAYAADREWSNCMHRKIGCPHLSVNRGGGRCYACSNSFLPCTNALAGCTHRVQNDGNAGGDLPACRFVL